MFLIKDFDICFIQKKSLISEKNEPENRFKAAKKSFEKVIEIFSGIQQKPAGGSWGGCSPSQIFAKVDLLPIDNYSEKEKIANKKNTNQFKFL